MGAETEADNVLEYLLGHKLEFTRTLLKESGLPQWGPRETLRETLTAALGNGELTVKKVIAYLDRVEGWGNQHVYLYRSPQALLTTWRNEAQVKKLLDANGYLPLLKKPRPTLLPKNPTLSSIDWDPTRARLVWVVKRTWEERAEAKDKHSTDGRTFWKAYEERTARGILAFDWDLGTGVAMIMIERLPSGTNYDKVRDEIIRTLKPLIDLQAFQLLRVSRSILKIAKSSEVDVRKRVDQTKKGGKIALVSPGRNTAVKDDPDLVNVQAALGSNTVGDLGNFYWLPTNNGHIERRLHTTIHAKDQRIGLFGDRTEEEVRYVIGRIRSYC